MWWIKHAISWIFSFPNVDKLKDQAKDLYQKLEDLDFHVDKESVGNFFTRIIDAIVNFFQGLFGK